MANIFTNASQARMNSRNNTAIHTEIRGIEAAVLAGIDAGELNATVTTGTPMTTDADYYKAYYGITDNRSLIDQIDFVTNYFRDLGYGVRITQNLTNAQSLVWNISW